MLFTWNTKLQRRGRGGRKEEKERFTPKGLQCQVWAKPKSGAWNSIQVSHMGAGTQAQKEAGLEVMKSGLAFPYGMLVLQTGLLYSTAQHQPLHIILQLLLVIRSLNSILSPTPGPYYTWIQDYTIWFPGGTFALYFSPESAGRVEGTLPRAIWISAKQPGERGKKRKGESTPQGESW